MQSSNAALFVELVSPLSPQLCLGPFLSVKVLIVILVTESHSSLFSFALILTFL